MLHKHWPPPFPIFTKYLDYYRKILLRSILQRNEKEGVMQEKDGFFFYIKWPNPFWRPLLAQHNLNPWEPSGIQLFVCRFMHAFKEK